MGIPLRILIVEDSADDAALLVRILERGGFDVEWKLVDQRDAMQAALARGPVDLVFSDHAMPTFSSPAALQLLRESGHDAPFILISGMHAEAVEVLMRELGAQDCVIKSEMDHVLVPVVRRQLREAEKRRKLRLPPSA